MVTPHLTFPEWKYFLSNDDGAFYREKKLFRFFEIQHPKKVMFNYFN